jgi:hypothetical protein
MPHLPAWHRGTDAIAASCARSLQEQGRRVMPEVFVAKAADFILGGGAAKLLKIDIGATKLAKAA